MWKNDFLLVEATEESPSNANFYLHTHDHYEILFFLQGDSKFVIDGKNYILESGDIIVVRKNEMHRVYHNSSAKYHRIILYINPIFFVNHNCTDYEIQFANPQAYIGNQIKADYVRSSGLYNAFTRLRKYTQNYSMTNGAIVDAIITEIIYLINHIGNFSTSNEYNNQVEKIISYINNHYTEEINLEILEKNFFISKQYLCKIFRKATGLTVHDYIIRKRITRVRELCATQKNISDAAMLSGFSDYSSFYRTYKKLTGRSPKDDLFYIN